MRQIWITKSGPPEVLQVREAPDPSPGPGQVRIRVRAAGITIPVVPGVIPVRSYKQVVRFAARCGASVPAWLAKRFEGLDEDAETRQMVAAAVAAEQVLALRDKGVRDFHFYTLNHADLVFAICHLLGLRPVKAAQPAAV